MALSLVEYYGAGLMGVFLLFAALSGVKRMAADKGNGIHRRHKTTPMPSWMPIAAQWLISLLVSAMQFSVMLLVMTVGFRAWWGRAGAVDSPAFFRDGGRRLGVCPADRRCCRYAGDR